MKPRLVPRHPGLGLFVILISGIAVTSYLLERPRQSFYESKAASQLIKWWTIHDAMHPDTPITNITQLFAELPEKYPYWLHEQFRVFGKHEGFDRSIAEKYVIVRPGVPSRAGEIVLVSAKPYPVGGDMQRTAISRVGDHYQQWEMRDRMILEIFRQADRAIPGVSPAPRPPAPISNQYGRAQPFWTGIAIEFAKLEWNGISPACIAIIKKVVAAVVAGGLGVLLAFCFWPVTVIPLRQMALIPISNRQKLICVTWATVVLSAIAVLWTIAPAVNDSEVADHIIFPYLMVSYHWNGRGASWMFIPVLLQFPLYGSIIACAWRDDRFVGGMAVVVSAHVGAMLLSVFMAAAR